MRAVWQASSVVQQLCYHVTNFSRASPKDKNKAGSMKITSKKKKETGRKERVRQQEVNGRLSSCNFLAGASFQIRISSKRCLDMHATIVSECARRFKEELR
jgi:hypothetical protein